jgi:heme A synthase
MKDGEPSRRTWDYWVGSAEERAAMAARPDRLRTVRRWLAVALVGLTFLMGVSLLGAELGLARQARHLLVIAVAVVLAVVLYHVRSVRRRQRGR